MNIDAREEHRIQLEKPLLLIKAKKGILACAYLDIKTFNDTGEACVIVSGVENYDAMLEAKITKNSDISYAARTMGVKRCMTGKEALEIMDKSS